MAEQTKVFTVKINGIDVVIKDLETTKIAIDLLKKAEQDLENQLSNSDLSIDSLTELNSALVTTQNQLVDLGEAFVTFGGDVEQGVAATEEYQASLLNTSASSDLATKSINELGLEIGAIEEELKGLKVGDENFNALLVKSKQLEKSLEFVQLNAESVALGFVGIGKAGNTVEGLSVQMTALNAKLATLSDPLERAEIDKQIEQIKIAIVETETEAKKGIFPEGSLGRLEAEMESLAIKIKAVPAGSSEYKKLQSALDQTTAKAEFLGKSALDQKQQFRDLGTSITSAFGTGVGLVASFAGESESAQKAVLALQQAMAVVDFIQQTSETLRQVRQAKAVAGLALQTGAMELNTAATVQNAAAQGALGAATAASGATATGAGGAFKVFNAIVAANPIGAVIAAVVAVGIAVYALSSKFKPLNDIVNTVSDGFSGLMKAGEAFIANIDKFGQVFKDLGATILQAFINPLDSVKTALNLFGADFKTTELEKKFTKLGESAKEAGKAVGDGFAEGVDDSQKLRALDLQQYFNDLADSGAALEEALLGGSRSTSDARRAIRERELAEDRALAVEKIKIANNVTDAELAVLLSGNEKKIAELKRFQDETVKFKDAALVEDLKKIKEISASQASEAEARRQEELDDRKATLDTELELFKSNLGEINNFEEQRAANAKDRSTALAQLLLDRQKGEFKTVKEFNDKKAIIEKNAANEAKQIAMDEADYKRGLRDIEIEGEIASIQAANDKRRELGLITVEEEIKGIEDVKALRLESLSNEINNLEVTKESTASQQRLKEIAQEKLVLERETTKEKGERQVAIIERELDIQNRLLSIDQERLNNQLLLKEGVDTKASAEADKTAKALEKQKSLAFTISQKKGVLKSQLENIAKEEKKSLTIIQETYDATLKQLVLDEKALVIEEDTNKKLLKAKDISQEEYDLRKKITDEKRKGIEIKETNAKVNFEVNTEGVKGDAKKAGEDASKEFNDGVVAGLDNEGQVEAALTEFLQSVFGDAAGAKIAQLGLKLVGKLQELSNALSTESVANLDNQIAILEDKTAKIDEDIAEIDEGIAKTQENVGSLRDKLKDARGNERLIINQQLDEQAAKEQKLATQKASNEAQKQQFLNQQIALEKKKRQIEYDSAVANKKIAIATAIIQTAVGVTRAAATAPPAGFIIAGLIAALGAVQVATIAAQPIPQAATGAIVNEDGTLSHVVSADNGKMLSGPSHAKGGIMVNAEGGEAIISRKAVNANPSLVANLVNMGQPNAPIKKYAEGGIIPSPNQATLTSLSGNGNLNGIIDAIANMQINSTVAITDVQAGLNRVNVIDKASGF